MSMYSIGGQGLGQFGVTNVLDTLGVKMVFRSQLSSPYEVRSSDVAEAFTTPSGEVVVQERSPSQPNFFLHRIFKPAIDLQAGGLKYTYAPWGEPQEDLRLPSLILLGGLGIAFGYLAYRVIKC